MCRELSELGKSITGYAGGFDASVLTPTQAGEVMLLCSRMEASLGSIKRLAAARYAQGSAWKQEGFRSPADQLARRTGMSPANAKRALEAGQRMTEQPEVALAALLGELSVEQAAAVADGAAVNPARTRDLIEVARRTSMPELEQEVSRAKAAVTDQEARHRAIHSKRSFRRWTDRDGALQAHLYGHPEDGGLLWRAIDPIRRRLIMARREVGEGARSIDSLESVDYDALLALAAAATGHDSELSLDDLIELGLFPQLTSPRPAESTTPSPARSRRPRRLAGSPAKVIVRVDLDALLRGFPLDGEMCELDGAGPVPVSVIRQLLAHDATILAIALTRGRRVQGVYHHRRHPSAHQRTALELLYPTCAASGCSARIGLQADHRIDWTRTHYTVLDYLDRLCPHHHGLKTRSNWALVEGSGKRPFVPPTDPRHPGRRPPATAAPP